MNVAEASAKYKVSKQAIYQHLNKLKSKGRDENTGVINSEGMALLERIYNRPDKEVIQLVQADLTIAQDKVNQQDEEIARLKAAITALEGAKAEAEQKHMDELQALQNKLQAQTQAAEVLSVKLASAEEKTKALEGERDFLRDQLSKAIVPALPAADSKPEKVTFRQALALWLGGKSSTATVPKDKPE